MKRKHTIKEKLKSSEPPGTHSEKQIAPAMEGKPAHGDWNKFFHKCRTEQLRTLPKNAKVFLSAGCAGIWYFDWISENYGAIEKHIGIERYTPKPENLPPNVEWIENTVSDMSAVGDRSVDLVFSGQNIEHLWPEDVIGFMREAWRVLRTGGHLVMDSPNRSITTPLHWCHPEHILELTVDEAIELCMLSGFEVTKIKGLWLCKDPTTDQLMELWPAKYSPEWPQERRLRMAKDSPEHAFSWWLEARKKEMPPRHNELTMFVNTVFGKAWTEKFNQFTVIRGVEEQNPDGSTWLNLRGIKDCGGVFRGPDAPLRAGAYEASFRLMADVTGIDQETPVVRLEVHHSGQNEPFASQLVLACDIDSGQEQEFILPFELKEQKFGIQFRLISFGQGLLKAKLGIVLNRQS